MNEMNWFTTLKSICSFVHGEISKKKLFETCKASKPFVSFERWTRRNYTRDQRYRVIFNSGKNGFPTVWLQTSWSRVTRVFFSWQPCSSKPVVSRNQNHPVEWAKEVENWKPLLLILIGYTHTVCEYVYISKRFWKRNYEYIHISIFSIY